MTRQPAWGTIQEHLLTLSRRAAARLRQALPKARDIRHKGSIDLVTEMDQAVERMLIAGIRRRFPDHEIISEESEERTGPDLRRAWPRSRRVRWIIDPLDGTTNYAHRFPHFAVSIGIEYDGCLRLGAVANPMLKEEFFARRGGGAWRNGRSIRVSATSDLNEALLATGFPYDIRTSSENNFREFRAMALAAQAVRRAGAAALDLCDVACGRFDGFWEMKLKPWDVAAGALLVQEAGGRITDYAGRPFDWSAGNYLASNGRLHRALQAVLERAAGARRQRGQRRKEWTVR